MNLNGPKQDQASREMNTYLIIHAKGRAEGRVQEADRLLIQLGTKLFGRLDLAALDRLRKILAIDRLEAIAERLVDFDVKNWDDLLRDA